MEKNTITSQQVKHARFGTGNITSIKDNILKVSFGIIIKEFPYPKAINDGTLTLIPQSTPPVKNDYTNNITTIQIGKTIEAKTHAEFLNKLLKKDYKGYMKSSKKLADGKLLWMIELSPFESSSGWINQLVSKDLITETHIGSTFQFEHNTYKHALATGQYFDDSDRVIFDIAKKDGYRSYVFRGVFLLNKTKSSLKENIWDLIMSEYKI